MPIEKIHGVDLYYESHGRGAPLVLIPGFASGIWSWKYQIGPLARNFQVIVFDPRGISKSTAADGEQTSIGRIADDVSTLLACLGIAKANILGISFGGFVAQDLAIRYPEDIDKLVLACTSYGGKGHVPPSMDVLMAFASNKGLNSSERIRQYLTMAFSPEFVYGSPEIIEDFCLLREQNFVPEQVYTDQLVAATTFDHAELVRGIAAETLVLTGDRDVIVPMQNSVNLAEAMPNASLEIIRGGSHMFFVEQHEAFNTAVEQFLLRRK